MRANRTTRGVALLGGVALLASAAFVTGISTGADAGTLEKLMDMKVTSASLDMPLIPQTGAYADQLRSNLERISLPPGFKIELYAVVPDARHMAIGTNVGVVFVGTRKTQVWAVTDRDKDRVADEVKRFAPSISFSNPNGVCFSDDGFLYLAEHNRVLVFPAAEFFYEGPDVAVGVVQAQLVPKSEESFNHGARTCAIGPDNKLYVTLGQPYNVQPAAKREWYEEIGLGGIVRMNRDGSDVEVYVTGVRNSVGLAFNPANGELWFTDNQVDGMGDLIPPGELNRVTAMGQRFGFPWYGGGHVRTADYDKEDPPAEAVFPEVEMEAHAADLGMTFYSGSQFPAKYRGGIFSAQHGSWNRTDPVGARIMFTSLDDTGAAASTTVFASGWLNESTKEYTGRPVDVTQFIDGSLLVSDDLSGAIYRISYGE